MSTAPEIESNDATYFLLFRYVIPSVMHFVKNKIPYKNMKIWFEFQLENFPPEPDQLTYKKVTIEKPYGRKHELNLYRIEESLKLT